MLVEQRVIRLVEGDILREVGRHRGLAVGDQCDEGVLAHGLHGRVGPALPADRGGQVVGQILSARRARTVCRHHDHRIRQVQQRPMNGAIHRPRQVGVAGVAEIGQIGPADVTDEQ